MAHEGPRPRVWLPSVSPAALAASAPLPPWEWCARPEMRVGARRRSIEAGLCAGRGVAVSPALLPPPGRRLAAAADLLPIAARAAATHMHASNRTDTMKQVRGSHAHEMQCGAH